MYVVHRYYCHYCSSSNYFRSSSSSSSCSRCWHLVGYLCRSTLYLYNLTQFSLAAINSVGLNYWLPGPGHDSRVPVMTPESRSWLPGPGHDKYLYDRKSCGRHKNGDRALIFSGYVYLIKRQIFRSTCHKTTPSL